MQGKQSLSQLSNKYQRSVKTIQKYFDWVSLPELEGLNEGKANLVFDTTKISSGAYLMLFRANKKNIAYDFVDGEKTKYYYENLIEIEKRYKIQSFTLDGRFSVVWMLKRVFPKIPIQLCQFHFKKNIYRHTTMNPRTECGKDFIRIVKQLKGLTREEYELLLKNWETKYKDYLKELNEKGKPKHERLLRGLRSARRWSPYLFTYQDFPDLKIPNTTNSCEGFFSQLKSKLNIHHGLSLKRRIQMAVSIISS